MSFKKSILISSYSSAMATTRAEKDLSECTLALKKAKSNDPNDPNILNILKRMSAIPAAFITINLLKKTKAGKAVSNLRKSTGDERIKTMASELLTKMKRAASAQGYIVTKKQPTSSTAAGSTTSTSTSSSTSSISSGAVRIRLSSFVTSSTATKSTSPTAAATPARLSNNEIPGLRSTGNPARDHVQRKMYDVLKIPASNETESWPGAEELGVVAVTVEDCMNSQSPAGENPREYMIIVKRLMYNLRSNDPLRAAVVRALLPAYVLVVMEPKEMANDEMKALRAEAREYDKGFRRSNWKQAHAQEMAIEAGVKNPGISMYYCPRCRSRRVHSFAMQTRSADEPMTIFCTCLDCQCAFRRGG